MKNSALVVIALQNDITKNYREIIAKVNEAIDWAEQNELWIVYIQHNNLSAGTRTFKPGTHGAELVPELHVVSDHIFTKVKSNALTSEAFAELAEEDSLYTEAPNAKQVAYITRLVTGVNEHAAELDGYIAKYAKNWKFSRIPLVASAIMRVAMYEILYMQDIPNGAAINEAVEIAKKYETPETVKFINGILGSFAREEISQ